MKISPAWRVYLLGAMICAALLICSRHFSDRGGPYFMGSLTLAGVAYLLAIREFFRGRAATSTPLVASVAQGGLRATPSFPRHVVVFGLVLAAAWHVAFLRLPAPAGDDIHRYIWDGRLQRLGYNPYIVIPSDPAVNALHTPETRGLNNSNLPTIYPPGAELFFRAVTAIHESVFALRVAFVICDFAIALVLLDLLRTSGRSEHLVLVYAWNPLLAIEVAGSGHIDIVGVLLLVISVAALARSLGPVCAMSTPLQHRRTACATTVWYAIAALAYGLAVGVKFLPIVLLPLYWKRIRIRDAALAAIVVILLYVPFLQHGRIPFGSLGAYVQGFRFNGPIFAALAHVAPPRLSAGLAVLTGFLTAIWRRRATPKWSPEAFAWPMAASLLCAPVIFPWYLLWLLPFLTSASTLLLIVWTVSITATYVQWHLSTLRGSWGALPGWVMLLEYGCVVVAAAIISLRRTSGLRHDAP